MARRTGKRSQRGTGSHDPRVLYAASIERIEESELLFRDGRWVLSMYVAGLAVEALLQAFAIRGGEAHDARHGLQQWLNKSPAVLVDAIRGDAKTEWSELNTMWNNDLRYLSEAGLLGRLRDRKHDRGIKGGRESVLKICSRRCVDDARAVHNRGLLQWRRDSSTN